MKQLIKRQSFWFLFAFLFVFVANVNSQNTDKKKKKVEDISLEQLNIVNLNVMTAKEVRKIEAQGDAGMTAMDYNKAMESYVKLADAFAGGEKFQLKMAIACDSAGEINNAIKYYQNTIKINSNNYQALMGMGKIYLNHLDEIEEAVYLFENALKNAPEKEKKDLTLFIANIYEKIDQIDEARATYEKLLTESNGLIAFGNFEFRQGNSNEALKLFKQAKNKAPEKGAVYVGLAKSYEVLGKLDEAKLQYEWALENLEEKNFDGLPYYFSMFLLNHSPDDVFMVGMYLMTELNQQNPHPDAWRQFAIISVDNKDYAVLLETLEQVADKYRQLAEFNYYMGICYLETGNKTQAKAYLSVAAEKGSTKAKKILDEKKL